MKIYFGEVNYNADEVFEHEGVEYDFVLEIQDEGVVIRDTCDRLMPISFEDTLQLMKALKKAKRIITAKVMAEKVEDYLFDAPDQCV